MSAVFFRGLKVLDLSQGIAGPLCARLLADFGAECLKIEPVCGDIGRSLGPFAHDNPREDLSLLFTALNVNKRGITLNLDARQGQQILKRLVSECDIIVESFDPGYLDDREIGWKALHELNPRLIMTSVTPFGQVGPYADYCGEELLLYAASGIMSYSGYPDQEPIKHGGPQAQYEGGINGAAATAVAVLQRERNGSGEHVDISIMQCLAFTVMMPQSVYSFSGGVVGRKRRAGGPFNTVMACKDGYVVLGTPNEAAYRQMSAILDLPQMLEPPFADLTTRREHTPELYKLVSEALKTRSRKDLFLDARKPLVGNVQTPKDLLECPQLESRNFYREVEQPSIGTLKVPFALMDTSLGPPELRLPAPLLGEHNKVVLVNELGFTNDDVVALRQSKII